LVVQSQLLRLTLGLRVAHHLRPPLQQMVLTGDQDLAAISLSKACSS